MGWYPEFCKNISVNAKINLNYVYKVQLFLEKPSVLNINVYSAG